LSVVDSEPTKGLVGSTDADGNCHFKHIEPGRYNLSGEKSGFIDTTYKLILSLRAGDDLTDITLKLEPNATITGRVVDEDGDPVARAEVTPWHRQSFPGDGSMEALGREVTTNNAGEFRIEELFGGRYFLSARRSNDSRPSSKEQVVDSHGDPELLQDALTYYPESLNLDAAVPIDLGPGEQRGGIEIRLVRSRSYRIAGKVAFYGPAMSGYKVVVEPSHGGQGHTANPTANGQFEIDALMPGSYDVLLVNRGIGTAGKTSVEIDGADLKDVVLKPYRPARVKARVIVEGQTQGSWAALAYLRKNALENYNIWSTQNGELVFADVAPGKYILDILDPGNRYIKSIRSGGSALSPRAIELNEGDDLSLEVILSDATGRIDGSVSSGSDNQPDWSSLEITLAPMTAPEELFDAPHSVSLDQYGHFSLLNVRPGKYRIYAAQAIGVGWHSLDFVRAMESKGTDVEVHEKDTIQLQLNLIPGQETAAILQKLGIPND
jgi:hypothetical protein